MTNTTAEARPPGAVGKGAGVTVALFGATETTHDRINADRGVADDPPTRAVFEPPTTAPTK